MIFCLTDQLPYNIFFFSKLITVIQQHTCRFDLQWETDNMDSTITEGEQAAFSLSMSLDLNQVWLSERHVKDLGLGDTEQSKG